jgi:hypothetical protein
MLLNCNTLRDSCGPVAKFITNQLHQFTIERSHNTLCMSSYIVASWGWLQVVAETCSSIFANQILVQLVGSKLLYMWQCTEEVQYKTDPVLGFWSSVKVGCVVAHSSSKRWTEWGPQKAVLYPLGIHRSRLGPKTCFPLPWWIWEDHTCLHTTPNWLSCTRRVSRHCSLSGDLPEQAWHWPRTRSADTTYCVHGEFGSAVECFCVRSVGAFLAEGSAQPQRDQTLLSSEGRSCCDKLHIKGQQDGKK